MSSASQSLSNTRKAAILLVLLGDEASTEICKQLDKEELKLLAQEISDLGYIPAEIATAVLQEYQGLIASSDGVAKGGPEYATRLAVNALGDEGSQQFVKSVIRAKEASAHSLAALERADPKQLAKLLQQEHPQTIALVLASMNSAVAKVILMLLPEEIRNVAIRRLAQTQNYSPELVSKIYTMLHEKLRANTPTERKAYGGVKAAADLLNRMDRKIMAGILEGIEKDNAELATSIRDQMFTFEDLAEVQDAGLRELLTQVDKKLLATALRNAPDKLKERIYGCMSSRAVEMLKEDSEAMGALRASDIKQAQSEMVNIARRLESEGKLILRDVEGEETNAG